MEEAPGEEHHHEHSHEQPSQPHEHTHDGQGGSHGEAHGDSHEQVHTHPSEHLHAHKQESTVTKANFFENAKKAAWDNRVIIILLVAIFLIAFGIRGHLLQYHYLFEFDAFYHARLVEDLILHGHIINPDPLVYYQLGGMSQEPWSLYHGISQLFYYIYAFGRPFSKDLLMASIQLGPVIFGSIISVLMYFLAKEVTNSKKIGLIAAFVAAVTPAFAYRTMAGAQGDNAFGFFWFVLGFIFFVRAVKNPGMDRKQLINAGLAGIFFGLMTMTWRMYLLIPLVVIGYYLFAVVFIASKQEEKPENIKSNHAFTFSVKVFISMLIFHVITYAYGEDWIADALGYVSGAVHLGTGTLLILTLIASIAAFLISVFLISKASKGVKANLSVLVILALYASFFVMALVFITVPDLVDRTTISSMVGEESVGYSFFGSKFNAFLVFPFVGLIFFPIGLYLFKKNDSHTGIIFFFLVLLTLFMAWYKLKFTFALGFAMAAAVAMVAYMLFEGLKKFNIEKGIETKIVFAAFFFLLILGVGASARFFPDYVPFVDQNPQWQSAISWINTNTPADAKFFNWWDQGHILAFLTDRKYSTDNRNSSPQANTDLAQFVIDTNAADAYNIASKNIGADYVILDSTMFESAPTFEYYVANTTKVDPAIIQKYYNGNFKVLNCAGADTNSPTILCEGASLTRDQWNNLSAKWKSVPDDFQNGSAPLFYYRTSDQVLVLNQALNNTNLAKVWLNSDETNKYYERVYLKQGILILKIKK